MRILTLIKNRKRKDIQVYNFGSLSAIMERFPIVIEGSEVNYNRAIYLLRRDGEIKSDNFYLTISELIQKKQKSS